MFIKAKKLDAHQSGFLDFIRGGAALLVLIAHCQQIFVNPYWFPHKDLDVSLSLVLYRHLGSIGVMLFFVLSGFLIYQSIANNLSNNRNLRFDIKSFFVSRLVRLYPPLLVATGISLIAYFILWLLDLNLASDFSTGKELYLARNELVISWKEVFGSLLFINTIIEHFRTPSINGPLWSLAHEFWFYVLAAFVVLFSLSFRNIWLAVLSFTFLILNVNEFFWYGFVVWCAGFLAAWLWSSCSVKLTHLICLTLSVSLFLFWLYALNESSSSYFFNNRNKFLFGLSFAFAIPLILSCRTLLGCIKNSKFFLLIGGASAYAYTLYLIHFPLMLLLFVLSNKLVDGNWFGLLIQVVLSISIIILISRAIAGFVEDKRRLNLMKERLSSFLNSILMKLNLGFAKNKREL